MLQETTQKVCSGQTLHKLEPETTYCLKVKASSPGHQGLYSPIYCLKTPKGMYSLFFAFQPKLESATVSVCPQVRATYALAK